MLVEHPSGRRSSLTETPRVSVQNPISHLLAVFGLSGGLTSRLPSAMLIAGHAGCSPPKMTHPRFDPNSFWHPRVTF